MTRSIPVFLIAGVFLSVLLAGCSSARKPDTTSFPPLNNYPVKQLEDHDLLAVSVDMRAFLDRHVNQYTRAQRRLQELNYAITHPSVLGFDYSVSHTLTAEQTFNREEGNCVAYANMFVALARAAGLRAYYQEVITPPSWSERSGVMVLSKHINVLVKVGNKHYTVDITNRKVTDESETRVISDTSGEAYYYNNLAVDALFEDDLATAYGYLVKALKLDATLSFLWSNLGVVYKRNDQLAAAEWAYLSAMAAKGGNYMAMANLAGIYTQQGKHEAAQALQARARSHRLENPYYLLLISEDAVAESRYDDAIKLLTRAIRKKKNGYRFHFAMARVLYLTGQVQRAESSYRKARELAPAGIVNTELDLSLAEIMASRYPDT